MKKIALSNGLFATVDDVDFDSVSKFKWTALHKHKATYAIRNIPKRFTNTGRYKRRYLHHEIIGVPQKGNDVNHIDGDALNNCRDNLEVITHRENLLKTWKHRKGTLPGAYFKKVGGYVTKPWESRVMIKGTSIYIGMFATAKEASAAYFKTLADHKIVPTLSPEVREK